MQTFLLWTTYFALHSLLAADAVKDRIARRLPGVFRIYRLLYNLFALAALAFLIWHFIQQPVNYLFVPEKLSRFAGGALTAAGLAILAAAFQNYDISEFAGIPARRPATNAPDTLHTTGLNAWVRHPLYLGTLLVVAGGWLLYPAAAATAIFAAVLFYLPFGIYWEEKKLSRRFGQTYRNYQQRVKRLIPGLW